MLRIILDLMKDRRNLLWLFKMKPVPSTQISPDEPNEELLFSFTVDVESDFGLNRSTDFQSLHKGLSNLLKMLNTIRAPATFFILSKLCEQFPECFCKIKRHHEIGLHGYAHECWGDPQWWLPDVHVLSPERKEELLQRSIRIIKKKLGVRARSFRAPYLVANLETLALLDEFGFKVDSSAPAYYGVPPCPSFVGNDSLVEIPVSANPRPRIAFLPLPHLHFDFLNTKLLVQRGVGWSIEFVNFIVNYQISRGVKPHLVMLTHEWEFAGIPLPSKPLAYAAKNNAQLLSRFILNLKEKYKIKFVTMQKLRKLIS